MKIRYTIVYIIIILILIFDFQAFSHNTFQKESKPSFETNNFLLSFGFGSEDKFTYDFMNEFFIDNYPLGFFEMSMYYQKKTPLYAKAEFAVNDYVSFGIHLNRSYFFENYMNNIYSGNKTFFNKKWISTSVIPRINFNFSLDRYFTLYFGAGIGYHYLSYKLEELDNSGVLIQSSHSLENETEIPIAFETSFGMRYFPIKNVGFYWEYGLSKSPFQGGLVIKF